MKKWKMIVPAVFFAIALIAGCSGNGGSGGGNHASGDAVLSGIVFNNHTDEDSSARTIAGATVMLVKAEDVESADSVSPIEDLVNGNDSYPSVTTDSDGYYQFTTADFSDVCSVDFK